MRRRSACEIPRPGPPVFFNRIPAHSPSAGHYCRFASRGPRVSAGAIVPGPAGVYYITRSRRKRMCEARAAGVMSDARDTRSAPGTLLSRALAPFLTPRSPPAPPDVARENGESRNARFVARAVSRVSRPALAFQKHVNWFVGSWNGGRGTFLPAGAHSARLLRSRGNVCGANSRRRSALRPDGTGFLDTPDSPGTEKNLQLVTLESVGFSIIFF